MKLNIFAYFGAFLIIAIIISVIFSLPFNDTEQTTITKKWIVLEGSPDANGMFTLSNGKTTPAKSYKEFITSEIGDNYTFSKTDYRFNIAIFTSLIFTVYYLLILLIIEVAHIRGP